MTGVSMSEAELQQAVIDLARLRGWLAYHTHDSRRSQPGFPDLVLVRRGRIKFAELKSATGRLTAAQREWLDVLGETPADVHIWRPEDLRAGLIDQVLR